MKKYQRIARPPYRNPALRRLLFALPVLALPWAARAEVPATATGIAVLDFDYRDTSAEPRDQTAEHQARLSRFMTSLRDDLVASEKFHIVTMACRPNPCSLQASPPAEIFERARQASARLLVFGEIQKISTLVQLGNFHVVDVEKNAAVIDRILSFRGDFDEAWRRAEEFVAKELTRDIPIE
jgi:hypothetical protein